MASRRAWLLPRNRSSTESSTWLPGTIFLGARARLVCGDGSMKLLINHRPNHPGVISRTAAGLPSNEPEIAGTYCSLVMHRCSRHCPTLHASGRGCQLSCSGFSPVISCFARWSEASSSAISRTDQAGAVVEVGDAIGQVYARNGKPFARVQANEIKPRL